MMEASTRQPGPSLAVDILTTARLRLEPIEEWHANVLFDGLQDEGLYEFIDDKPPVTLEALRERYQVLARRHSPDGSDCWLNWAVFVESEQRYIGYVQATLAQNRSALIGYLFFRSAWGKGYATEAVNRMLFDLRETWQCLAVRAVVDVRNSRSISLLQGLGFERVTTRSELAPTDGTLLEEVEYQLLS